MLLFNRKTMEVVSYFYSAKIYNNVPEMIMEKEEEPELVIEPELTIEVASLSERIEHQSLVRRVITELPDELEAENISMEEDDVSHRKLRNSERISKLSKNQTRYFDIKSEILKDQIDASMEDLARNDVLPSMRDLDELTEEEQLIYDRRSFGTYFKENAQRWHIYLWTFTYASLKEPQFVRVLILMTVISCQMLVNAMMMFQYSIKQRALETEETVDA